MMDKTSEANITPEMVQDVLAQLGKLLSMDEVFMRDITELWTDTYNNRIGGDSNRVSSKFGNNIRTPESYIAHTIINGHIATNSRQKIIDSFKKL